MLVLELIKNERGQVHVFQYTYLLSYQIHLQAIIYYIEDIHRDNHRGFLTLKFFKHFLIMRIVFISTMF